MTLQKALKLKKKLAGEIAKHASRMRTSNSKEVGTKSDFNAEEEYNSWVEKTVQLIELKKKIYVANMPIVDKIFRLAELKGMIQTLKAVPTKEGKARLSGYGSNAGEQVDYEAVISSDQVNSKIEEWEVEIEILQDELDEFNAKTDI